MIPPLSTRLLQAAIESKRREEAAARWKRSLDPSRERFAPSRRDIPRARSTRV